MAAVWEPAGAPDAAELQAKLFHGLSHPVRLRILLDLLESDRRVGELTERLGLGQSHVSNHLACLRWCGLVRCRRAGRAVRYSLADPRIRRILELGCAVVADHAARIAACTRM